MDPASKALYMQLYQVFVQHICGPLDIRISSGKALLFLFVTIGS